MCSIIGYCGICDDLDEFQKGFDKTISRGPDDSRIVDTGNGLLGFHRLAIMGLTASGMQPFSLGGSYVVCNGEIFGFERLRESLSDRYTFQSDSDCEVLLPLYETYGTEMFRILDAEFACIQKTDSCRNKHDRHDLNQKDCRIRNLTQLEHPCFQCRQHKDKPPHACRNRQWQRSF